MVLENSIGETAELRRPWFASLGPALSKVVIAIAGASLLIASAPSARAQDSESDAGVSACGNSIATCGCTITKPGFYQVTANLLSSQGLTAKNGCIDIKAPKVTLNFGTPPPPHQRSEGFFLTGPGGMTPTGIGIHILKGSNGDFVELPSEIDGWDVAILIEGSSNIVEDFDANSNGTAGVEINGGKNNNINDFSAGSNKNFGVWLRGASNNQVNCSNTEDNGNVGVYVGCSSTGLSNAKCGRSVPPSKSNRIYDHSARNNLKYGVVIDLGNTNNSVSDVDSSGNTTMDMVDANASCDHDVWFFNHFVTASESCIN
jgi:Right handed beta helix region